MWPFRRRQELEAYMSRILFRRGWWLWWVVLPLAGACVGTMIQLLIDGPPVRLLWAGFVFLFRPEVVLAPALAYYLIQRKLDRMHLIEELQLTEAPSVLIPKTFIRYAAKVGGCLYGFRLLLTLLHDLLRYGNLQLPTRVHFYPHTGGAMLLSSYYPAFPRVIQDNPLLIPMDLAENLHLLVGFIVCSALSMIVFTTISRKSSLFVQMILAFLLIGLLDFAATVLPDLLIYLMSGNMDVPSRSQTWRLIYGIGAPLLGFLIYVGGFVAVMVIGRSSIGSSERRE